MGVIATNNHSGWFYSYINLIKMKRTIEPNSSINSAIYKNSDKKAPNQVILVDLLGKTSTFQDIDTWLNLTTPSTEYIEFNDKTGEWGRDNNSKPLSFVDVGGEMWAVVNKSVAISDLILFDNKQIIRREDGQIWAILDESPETKEVEGWQ